MSDREALATYQSQWPLLWESLSNYLRTHGIGADSVEYINVDWPENVGHPGLLIVSTYTPDDCQEVVFTHESWDNTNVTPQQLVQNCDGLLRDYNDDRHLYPWLLAYECRNIPTLTIVRPGYTVVNTFCPHTMARDLCLECNPQTSMQEFSVV